MERERNNQPDVTEPGTKIGEQVSDLNDGDTMPPQEDDALLERRTKDV